MLLLHLPLLLPRNISGCYFSVLDVVSRKLLSNITCFISADDSHYKVDNTFQPVALLLPAAGQCSIK